MEEEKKDEKNTGDKKDDTKDDTEVIQITRGELKTLAKELSDEAKKEFSGKLDRQEEQIKLLTEAADLNRLNRAQQKLKGALIHTVYLSTLKGQVVVAWENIVDMVEKIGAVWTEKQIMRVHLEDGTSEEMPYIDFHQQLQKSKVLCDILARTVDNSGSEVLKVKRQDTGKVYEIDVTFVN